MSSCFTRREHVRQENRFKTVESKDDSNANSSTPVSKVPSTVQVCPQCRAFSLLKSFQNEHAHWQRTHLLVTSIRKRKFIVNTNPSFRNVDFDWLTYVCSKCLLNEISSMVEQFLSQSSLRTRTDLLLFDQRSLNRSFTDQCVECSLTIKAYHRRRDLNR